MTVILELDDEIGKKSLKNEMFIFGLHSISDEPLSNPSDENVQKKLNARFWITFNF